MSYLSPVSVLLAALATGQAQAWLASTAVAALGLDTARLSLDLTATAGDQVYVFASNAALAPGNSITPLDPQDPATWPGAGKGLTLVSGPVVGGAGATSVAADQLGPFLTFVRVLGTAAHNMLVSGQVGGTSTGGVASSVVNAAVASVTGGTGATITTTAGPVTITANGVANAVNTVSAAASGAGGSASAGLVASADGLAAASVGATSTSGSAIAAVGAIGDAGSISSMAAGVTGGTGARVRCLASGSIELAPAVGGTFVTAATVTAAGVTARAGRALLAERASGTFTTGFAAPAGLAANLTYTLPATDGASGSHLTTNGAGVLSWT